MYFATYDGTERYHIKATIKYVLQSSIQLSFKCVRLYILTNYIKFYQEYTNMLVEFNTNLVEESYKSYCW